MNFKAFKNAESQDIIIRIASANVLIVLRLADLQTAVYITAVIPPSHSYRLSLQ